MSRAAVASRPKLLYTVLREVLATHDAAADRAWDDRRARGSESCVGGNTQRSAREYPGLLMLYTPPPVDKSWSSLHLAHTMEKRVRAYSG